MSREYPHRRRPRFLRWLGIGAALGIAIAVAVSLLPGARPDYRDTVTLAHALKDAKGGQAADCAKISGNVYACAVGLADGSQGMYRVTVSPDGWSWSVTG